MRAGSLNTQLFCSPHPDPSMDPLPPLLALINGAKTSIAIGIYSITLAAVADALIAAHQRGVSVTVAADATEARATTSKVADLAAFGIAVRVWGSQYHLAHFKVIVVDGKTAALGSYNFSTEAETDDYEVFAVFTGVEVARGGMAAALTALIMAAYNGGTSYSPPPSS